MTWQEYVSSLAQYRPQQLQQNAQVPWYGVPSQYGVPYRQIPFSYPAPAQAVAGTPPTGQTVTTPSMGAGVAQPTLPAMQGYKWPIIQKPTNNDYTAWNKLYDRAGILGMGVANTAGDLLVHELSKKWQDAGAKGDQMKTGLQADLLKNIGSMTTNSLGQFGDEAAASAQLAHAQQRYNPEAMAQINAANRSAGQVAEGGQGLGRQLAQQAATVGGRAANQGMAQVLAGGGPASAVGATGAKIMGAIDYGSLANSAMAQSIEAGKAGAGIRQAGGAIADQMYNTDYKTHVVPHETRTDFGAAVNATTGLGAIAQNETWQNSTFMPSNPVTPVAQNTINNATNRLNLQEFDKYLRGEV